jgi:hypothetical protein
MSSKLATKVEGGGGDGDGDGDVGDVDRAESQPNERVGPDRAPLPVLYTLIGLV